MTLLTTLLLVSAPLRTLPVLDKSFEVIGSGILLDRQAVLTAAHVIKHTEPVFACGNGPIRGHLMRFDVRYDLALVALDKPCEGIEISTLAAENAVKNTKVSFHGYPDGVRHTGVGSVSSYTDLPGPPVSRTYMVIDGLIRPGNSGGPVLNAQGQLVGMVQGKICYSRGNELCFGTAIPLKTIKKFFLEFSP